MNARTVTQRRRGGPEQDGRGWSTDLARTGSAPLATWQALTRPPGGQPLEAGTRTAMERRFGHDFSQVRVHADAAAAQAAEALGAHAFTVGDNMVFNAGQLDAQTGAGQRLLAHELTHVVQQRGSGATGKPSQVVSQRGDPAEQEAERTAGRVVAGHHVDVREAPTAEVARDSIGDPNAGNHDTWNAASSLFWDVAGLIPGGAAVSTAVDVAELGANFLSGDSTGASAHWKAAQNDALGMIPIVGTALGAASTVVDTASLLGRGVNDMSAAQAPTSGDVMNSMFSGLRAYDPVNNALENWEKQQKADDPYGPYN